MVVAVDADLVVAAGAARRLERLHGLLVDHLECAVAPEQPAWEPTCPHDPFLYGLTADAARIYVADADREARLGLLKYVVYARDVRAVNIHEAKTHLPPEGVAQALRVRLLLDTHAFLRRVTDSDELSRRARRLIADGRNEIFFSAVSAWEIVIKSKLRRVTLPEDAERYIPEQLEQNAFEVLPVRLRQRFALRRYPTSTATRSIVSLWRRR